MAILFGVDVVHSSASSRREQIMARAARGEAMC